MPGISPLKSRWFVFMTQRSESNESKVNGACPAHPNGLQECYEALKRGDSLDGCDSFEETPKYIPRRINFSLDPKHLMKLRAKNKSENRDGEPSYLSPSERLNLKVDKLLREKDSKELSSQAFSIVVSLVNHHINQYRRQCDGWIRSTHLEDLVIADLMALDIYGFREWVPEGGPLSQAIQWDKAVEDAISRNLPDLEKMSLTEAIVLAEEIDRTILQESEHANLKREKGLLVRQLRAEKDYSDWIHWRNKNFTPRELLNLAPSVEYRALQLSDLDSRIGLSKLKKFRSRLKSDSA